MFTNLKDRTLWYDGDSTIEPSSLESWMMLGNPISQVYVSDVTEDIKRFNRLVDKDKQISIKQSNTAFDFSWVLPSEYQTLEIGNYVAKKFLEQIPNMEPKEVGMRAERIVKELDLYEKMGLQDVLRAIIYIINTLESQNVVWGVGRGSSVSSYVLYLIGAHDIDSVTYCLSIEDFLHD